MATNTLRIGNKAAKPALGQVRMRFDRAKYRRNIAGLCVDAPDDTTAVWCFRGKDSDGPYYGLMCVTKP